MNKEPAPEGAIRVLIADDDARVRHALRALLESDSGIRVVGEASSPADVLRGDTELRPSVILLDLIMPEADDGFRLLTQLTQRPERCVVAMSLRNSLGRKALEAGARAFLEKGAAPDVVLSALRTGVGAFRADQGTARI